MQDTIVLSDEKEVNESVADDYNMDHHQRTNQRFGVITTFMECIKQSSFPGLQLLASRSTTLPLKLIWLLILLLCIILNIVAICHVHEDWSAISDDIQTYDSKMPIWNIPFPAITICPETKANKTMLNITEVFHDFKEAGFFANQTKERQVEIAAVAQVCDHFIFGQQDFNEHILGPECVDAIRKMAVTKSEMLFYCKFRNDAGLCDQMFHEVLTNNGVCFTFNMLNASDIFRNGIIHEDYPIISHEEVAHSWSLDKGYAISNLLDLYPKRALAGANNGLFVLLRLYKKDLDFICRGPLQGFKVAVHAPNSVPKLEKHYFRVPLEQEVIATISPSVIKHSDELRQMAPNERQCYFHDEQELKFFKEYSQDNCELECAASYVKEHCGCVRFNMPRRTGEKICGGADIDCVTNATMIHQVSEASEELETSVGGKIGTSKCNCLPTCSHIEYEVTTTQAYFDWRSLFHAFKNPIDESKPMELSRLSIILKSNHIPVHHRKAGSRSVWILWALFGGMVAICSGISLLSICEVIFNLCFKYRDFKTKANKPQLMSMEPTFCDQYVNI